MCSGPGGPTRQPAEEDRAVNLLVAARRSLLDADVAPERPALLLEGSWPDSARAPQHDALDEAVDDRFAWIDRKAVELTSALERFGSERPGVLDAASHERFSAAYLNALALRYYLVKLLRPVAYFTQLRPLSVDDRVELVAAPGDEDYAELMAEICRAAGAGLDVRRPAVSAAPRVAFPPNPRWRRWARRLAELLGPADRSRLAPRHGARPRVVLCGNPRLLDPACAELRRCGCRLWWLFDRFALKSWLRWRPAGVGQLVCDSSLGGLSRLRIDVPERLECRGINVAGPVRRWLSARAKTHGRRQTRLVEQVDAHFRRLRPDALVLDEDATPLARAAVGAARRWRTGSLVVQHGVPCSRVAFTPLAADRFLAWGESSADRLVAWGMARERISLVGSPLRRGTNAKRLFFRTRRSAAFPFRPRPRVLLLCTTPPRDGRPDTVAMRLTRRTYETMLRAAFSAVAALGSAELIVKLHPRAPDDPTVRTLRARLPGLRVKIVRRGRLAAWLRRVDCVVSCGSTGGVEAADAGLPVIQLAPPGTIDFPPAESFGMLGTATREADLLWLLGEVRRGSRPAARVPGTPVFAGAEGSAAARIADEVIGLIALRDRPERLRGNGSAKAEDAAGGACSDLRTPAAVGARPSGDTLPKHRR